MASDTPLRRATLLFTAGSLTSTDFADAGISRHRLALLVRSGAAVRLRRGRYARSDLDPELLRSARLGGRLDCISLMRSLGVFVHSSDALHVQFEREASRLPPPPDGVVRHWRTSARDSALLAADIHEALAQAFRCQGIREAIATMDNAWHHGLIDEEGVRKVFALLPRRFRRLRELLDHRSESGPETLMRLLLRGIARDVAVQVEVTGVGRVDFVVDGWLIVECDSRAYHEGWEAQLRDRRRDLAAAALGYTTVRPTAQDILYNRDEVLSLMKQVLAHRHSACATPASSAARAVRRADSAAPR